MVLAGWWANVRHGRASSCYDCRTETVVERLLAGWLSVCLYEDSLHHRGAGRALHLLYEAVKRQTDKGPVDAVTGDARYCLSEDRLLRLQLNYSTLVRTLATWRSG